MLGAGLPEVGPAATAPTVALEKPAPTRLEPSALAKVEDANAAARPAGDEPPGGAVTVKATTRDSAGGAPAEQGTALGIPTPV